MTPKPAAIQGALNMPCCETPTNGLCPDCAAGVSDDLDENLAAATEAAKDAIYHRHAADEARRRLDDILDGSV